MMFSLMFMGKRLMMGGSAAAVGYWLLEMNELRLLAILILAII
jgi:hypothetical protein